MQRSYYDIFAAKLDPAGNWLWAAGGGGSGNESGMDIAVDSAGNSYVTGNFYATATFGPHTLMSYGTDDIFAAKLDSAGNWLWAVKAGGTTYDYAHGIATDSGGNSYLAGVFEGTATFGPHTLSSGGSGDIFAAKLGPTGNWLWAVRAGGPSIASGVDITVNGSGTAWLTGYYYGTASFGSHSITASGSYDAFAAKLVYSTPVDDGLIPEANTRTRLHNAWPNPFHRGESTQIKADVASGETGILRIFNLRGQCLQSHELGPGSHQIRLDSQNLPGGIYLYNLQTGLLSETKKLVLLK
ncbi:MAG: T9SS type A sorting domain-containing protein [Candidatus Cloacimonetes bacterium]|nr:T9SS type A sorting domain-containing protein [Candidatus Cloacimonadota bacterium]